MEHTIPLAAEKIGQIGFLPITNTLIVSWFVVLTLIIIGYFGGKGAKLIPSGFQNVVELLLDPIYNLTSNLAHSKAKFFFPVITTFFLYILFANWFGLFPGFGTVGFYESHQPSDISRQTEEGGRKIESTGHEENKKSKNEEGKKVFVPFLRSINADLNMTLGLGLLSVAITHLFAVKFLGFGGYLKKWFSLNPIFLFVGVLELVGEGTKTLSLSLRLFGNIFAGEVVLSTISNLLAFVVPLPFYFLEIIVGVVQASVFMMLTLVFMVLLTEKHGTEEH